MIFGIGGRSVCPNAHVMKITCMISHDHMMTTWMVISHDDLVQVVITRTLAEADELGTALPRYLGKVLSHRTGHLYPKINQEFSDNWSQNLTD